MKPRLKAQPLTFEDAEIRMLVDVRFLHLTRPVLQEWPSFSWILCDRRDADLMFKFLATRADASYVMWATYGLPYPDIEAIISEWLR